MRYEVVYMDKTCHVNFFGVLSIGIVEEATTLVHNDERFYNCVQSIWDLKNCDTSQMAPDQLAYVVALDLGAAVTLSQFNLKLLVNDDHTYDLCNQYKMAMAAHKSPWDIDVLYEE